MTELLLEKITSTFSALQAGVKSQASNSFKLFSEKMLNPLLVRFICHPGYHGPQPIKSGTKRAKPPFSTLRFSSDLPRPKWTVPRVPRARDASRFWDVGSTKWLDNSMEKWDHEPKMIQLIDIYLYMDIFIHIYIYIHTHACFHVSLI